MSDFSYAGTELELFASVRRWKSYWSGVAAPYITGDVLEVGAGLGANTPFLDRARIGRWVCLEPDAALAGQLATRMAGTRRERSYEFVCGTLDTLNPSDLFDTLIYIDVLEHIEDDRGELSKAASRLRAGGRLIVLSPAHQRLFTPFDAAVGHFRRYDRAMLRRITPPDLPVERLLYLDSAGLLLSAGNAVLLRQSMPTRAQLLVWDRAVVPVSRVLDRVLFHAIGKSILGVWRKSSSGHA
jgi:SAM-dependent methyltransferase